MYSEENKELVRIAVKSMEGKMKTALILRFWESLTIEEIAKELRISWIEADQLIEKGIEEIRNNFFKEYFEKQRGNDENNNRHD